MKMSWMNQMPCLLVDVVDIRSAILKGLCCESMYDALKIMGIVLLTLIGLRIDGFGI